MIRPYLIGRYGTKYLEASKNECGVTVYVKSFEVEKFRQFRRSPRNFSSKSRLYTIMCVLIDVFVLLCSFVIICLLYIFVVVVFFFVADTLYRLCLLCMPSIVVNLIIIIIIIICI